MKKVILFGASGNLGREIAHELVRCHFELTVVVRNEQKAVAFKTLPARCVIADVTKRETLTDICSGQDIVISALGKSVSPNDRSKPSFREVDLAGNTAILQQALKSRVSKFIYISAFHAERYPHLEYFRVHHDFSEKLKESGIDYAIIKPPALFSAFLDMIAMARRGVLFDIGTGDKKTNPIAESDLAQVCADAIQIPNAIIEAGGKNIYTRAQLTEIIQRAVNPNQKVRTLPLPLFKAMLPLLRMLDKNTYDKFAFIIEVMQHDTIAPQVGETRFEAYIQSNLKKENRGR